MLAIVDSNFPWIMSGFRYWENMEFYNIDKEILFFTFQTMNDTFPTDVYPVKIIKKFPVTSLYCVFLNFTLSLLDYPGEIPGKNFCFKKQGVISRLLGRKKGLSEFIKLNNISVHTTIYPGGGFHENFIDQAIEGLKFIGTHPNVKNVFTNLSIVQEIIPRAHWVPCVSNLEFYKYVPRTESEKIHVLFSCHNRREKGFSYLAKALNSINHSKYHLHIVGDWKDELHLMKNNNYTYYGLLSPEKLREVYYKCHVIVTPGYTDDAPPGGYVTIDGFPTTVAVDAMSTGCCLISTNIRKDYRTLMPGIDYLEINEKSSDDILNALEYLYSNQNKMLSMVDNAHRNVLKFFDVKKNVCLKYKKIKMEYNKMSC